MHIDEKNLENFQNGHMDTEEMIAFLEHLDHCNFCMEQMLTKEEQRPSAAPAYLKTQILQSTLSPEVKASKAIRSSSYKMQLFYDSLRTAAGVIMALFMLFSISQVNLESLYTKEPVQAEELFPPEPQPRENHLYNFSRKLGQELNDSAGMVSHCLNDFSNKLVNGGK